MELDRMVLRLLISLLLLSTLACSSKLLVPFETWAQIDVRVATDVNPDSSERPSPLVVRFYELSDTSAFQSKEFFDIYDDDTTALEKTLVAKEQYNYRPGESAYFERKLKEETLYLGVVAAFRNIDDARWRSVVALKPNRTNQIVVNIQGINIDIRNTR